MNIQQDYTLLRETMTQEPILEHLTAQFRARNPQPPTFGFTGFRVVDIPPRQQNNELDELYLQLQRAKRAHMELQIGADLIVASIMKALFR